MNFESLVLSIGRVILSGAFFVLLSCSSSNREGFDPEKGRIIHENSAAIVGPLLDSNDQSISELTSSLLESLESSKRQSEAKESSNTQETSDSTPTNTKSSKASSEESHPIKSRTNEAESSNLSPTQKDSPENEKQKTSKKKSEAEKGSKEQAVVSEAQADKTSIGSKNKSEVASPAKRPDPLKLSKNLRPKGAVVKGSIKFLDADGEPIQTKGSIVILKPLFDLTETETAKGGAVHLIDMENKIYTPQYSAVGRHDTLVFINKDKIKHNVFSSSGKNAFDLGTYGSGKQRTVNLGETGIVKIYCNIHPEMATFVSVNDRALNSVADPQGNFEFENVQYGEYELHVWHVRGEKRMNIRVSKNTENFYKMNVDTSPDVVEKHKNKFGKEYSKNSAMFEDEFY